MTRSSMVAIYRHERTSGERFPVAGLAHFFEPGRACPIVVSLDHAERSLLDAAHDAYEPLMPAMAAQAFEADLAMHRQPLQAVGV